MSTLSGMDMPTIDVDLGPERIREEKIGGPLVYCDLCDTEVVHKLAQMFLPGLASACVDNTTGDLFRTPGSVADDMRKELIDYVTQRSESFVAESVILESDPDGEVSDHPFDIISNFVDDFASSKRNFLTRVSGWLLSEKREDKIDDFVQELEMNGFWSLDRRERIAETSLKNVDFENKFHCSMKFNSEVDLANHVSQCNFRPMFCQNEGCNARFIAGHLAQHDSTCPFKIIPCEQKCSENIMRRDMDRHCITVCPMKLVNCPYYSIGCRSAIAQCLIEKHRVDDVQSHLWHLLKGMYKEASGEGLKRRVEQILQASSGSRLAEASNVRSLNLVVKDIETKLGPLEVSAVKENSRETGAKSDDVEDNEKNTKGSEPSTKAPDMLNSSDKAEVTQVSAVNENHTDTVAKNDDTEESENNTNGGELSTKAPDMLNSSDIAAVSAVIKNIADTDSKNDDSEDSENDIKGSEPSAKAPVMLNSSDTAAVSAVNENSADTVAKNDDGEDSENNTKSRKPSTKAPDMPKNKDGEHNHSESSDSESSRNSEDRTQAPNKASLSDEAEISHLNKDSAQIYSENKDGATSESDIEGDEEGTQENRKSLSDEVEINAANEDSAEKSSEDEHVEE